MAVFDKIVRNQVFPYGSENAVASFYYWFSSLFFHDEGYMLVFDREFQSAATHQELAFPCIVLNQVDTTDTRRTFIEGNSALSPLMFYIYCLHKKGSENTGTPRLLRRMRDQVAYCLRNAGRLSEADNDILVPPIRLLDFSKNPIVQLDSVLNVDSNIMQHYLEEANILRYEMLVTMTYIEKF